MKCSNLTALNLVSFLYDLTFGYESWIRLRREMFILLEYSSFLR